MDTNDAKHIPEKGDFKGIYRGEAFWCDTLLGGVGRFAIYTCIGIDLCVYYYGCMYVYFIDDRSKSTLTWIRVQRYHHITILVVHMVEPVLHFQMPAALVGTLRALRSRACS